MERRELILKLCRMMGWQESECSNLRMGTGLRLWQLRSLVGLLERLEKIAGPFGPLLAASPEPSPYC